MDPGNITAIASIAQIYYNMKKFDKAKEYQQRRLKLEPTNPEPYYWIGVMDWAHLLPAHAVASEGSEDRHAQGS